MWSSPINFSIANTNTIEAPVRIAACNGPMFSSFIIRNLGFLSTVVLGVVEWKGPPSARPATPKPLERVEASSAAMIAYKSAMEDASFTDMVIWAEPPLPPFKFDVVVECSPNMPLTMRMAL